MRCECISSFGDTCIAKVNQLKSQMNCAGLRMGIFLSIVANTID